MRDLDIRSMHTPRPEAPLADFAPLAQEITDSWAVSTVYAAPDWDELSDEGQQWVAALVRETMKRFGGKAPRRVHVSMDTDVRWSVRHFFRAGHRYAGGIVLGFAPTSFSLGAELITGETRGIALMIGPFWLGFAGASIQED